MRSTITTRKDWSERGAGGGGSELSEFKVPMNEVFAELPV